MYKIYLYFIIKIRLKFKIYINNIITTQQRIKNTHKRTSPIFMYFISYHRYLSTNLRSAVKAPRSLQQETFKTLNDYLFIMIRDMF